MRVDIDVGFPASPTIAAGAARAGGRERRDWTVWALGRLAEEKAGVAETPLITLRPAALPGITFHLKDESAQPSGSLKHRLARSLFVDAVVSGSLDEGATVVEASSGSTAVSAAFFADLLGLPFVAVAPTTTSRAKIEAIRRHGGRVHLVDDAAAIGTEAARLARACGGHHLDQFSHASRVSDWRRDNVAESLLAQIAATGGGTPDHVVMGLGTGGTAATIGRHLRHRGLATRLCAVDVENSVYFDSFVSGDRGLTSPRGSRIEGIGRPRVEASFVPGAIDLMLRVPDAASIAAMRVLSQRLGKRVGASTGTNFFGLCRLAAHAMRGGRDCRLASLVCDGGERYDDTYWNPDWVAAQGFDAAPQIERLEAFLDGDTAALG